MTETDITALRQEIARLTEQFRNEMVELSDSLAREELLKSHLARCRPYMQHKAGCRVVTHPVDPVTIEMGNALPYMFPKCDCGLDAALSGGTT